VPAPTYRWLCDYIAERWTEGNLAHAGFVLDDLAGPSWPLGQLTPEQREEVLAPTCAGDRQAAPKTEHPLFHGGCSVDAHSFFLTLLYIE
jgi:hypothetical protein